jgi:hypothetical protein
MLNMRGAVPSRLRTFSWRVERRIGTKIKRGRLLAFVIKELSVLLQQELPQLFVKSILKCSTHCYIYAMTWYTFDIATGWIKIRIMRKVIIENGGRIANIDRDDSVIFQQIETTGTIKQ